MTSSRTLRILVVADIDLRSASRLAEFALHDDDFVTHHHHHSGIDLCIACGPFTADEQNNNDRFGSSDSSKKTTKTKSSSRHPKTTCSREEDAAAEGSMTGALSQLENIVCRVIFIPGITDPPSTLIPSRLPQKRLTPNSRNLQHRWLTMATGLGCIGISQYDENMMRRRRNEKRETHVSNTNKIARDGISGKKDADTAKKLMEMAPEDASTILVTHFLPPPAETNTDLPTTIKPASVDVVPDDYPDWYPFPFRQFLDSSMAQTKIILNLAYTFNQDQYQTKNKNDIPIVCPGSLRNDGKFAMVDLEFVDLNDFEEREGRMWRVKRLWFRCMNDHH